MEQSGGDRRLHSAARLTRHRAGATQGQEERWNCSPPPWRWAQSPANHSPRDDFPDIQGKYRELSQFWTFSARMHRRNHPS